MLANTKIELYPLGANSPISSFLERNPAGGIHHVCYEVDDINEAANILQDKKAKILVMENRESGHTGNQLYFYIQRILWNSNRIRAEVELKMEIASGIVVYVLLWWWIFLMALPFGVSRQTDGGRA